MLGKIVEQNFMSSIIKANGSFWPFVDRPVAATLALLTAIVWLFPLVGMLRHRPRPAQTSS